jgi:anti-sigma regulatory factor (Ser/Thr protein kinase)/predicted transcriptional regulator
MNPLKQKVLDIIRAEKEIQAKRLEGRLNVSRQYLHRFLKELREEGKIALLGRANRAVYVLAEKGTLLNARKKIKQFHRRFHDKGLSEDAVLDAVKRDSGIFIDLPDNVSRIVGYAFTEMLNNAIDHSQSREIEVLILRSKGHIRFEITDVGIGIFHHIMTKRGLKNELEAIQDLLKGKETTDPEHHTGEGIFFTSKVADALTIKSSNKELTFNNLIDDVFIRDIKNRRGTKVTFVLEISSRRDLQQVFGEYTTSSYEFDKTKVAVKLYKMGTLYISRSQARRIMTGLERFKTVVLDFAHIKSIGQGFADEIFRVWRIHNPNIKIEAVNTNENIDFMINRARKEGPKAQQALFP